MTFAHLILVAFAAAQPSGVLTRAPELVKFVEAPYPPGEAAVHRGAEVALDVDVDEAGAVTAVSAISVSLEPPGAAPEPQAEARFANAAIEAARQFRFTPAEIDGKPAAVRITYRYRFTIREERASPVDAPVAVEGRLLERGTRRPLAGASVAAEGGSSAEADAQGRFALRGLPPGRWRIRVVSPDHERFETEEEVRAGEKTEVTYYVRRRTASPYESVVQGERDRKEVAKRSLSLEEIKRVPGTSGDAVAVVQMLPGVARVPYGLGLMPVRGTHTEDTRGYLDGINIPNIFHFGGLPISVVNADALSGVDFYPGNFSARFGRAIGGAIELRGRPGAADGPHGYADVSLLDAKALVEAPTSENGSFLATARRSYVDLILSAAKVDSISPRYYDYKDLSGLIVPSDRIVDRNGVLQQENFSNAGVGFSRGIEVLLRQELSRGLLGWISYTLSESRQTPYDGFPVTNFPFDQRHNVYAVVSQQLPSDWTIGASVRYTTGNWHTPITRGVYDSDCDCYQPIQGKLYSQRSADFFEIDFRVDKRWVYERWSLNAYLDLRNVTNRRNVELSTYNYDYSQRVDVPGLPLFPNIGIRAEF